MHHNMNDHAVLANPRAAAELRSARHWIAWALWLILACPFVSAHAQPARDLASDAVGASAGVFRVDESGQATYSISIAVPPGTAGVAPTLSLDYSSQAGTGVLGKGWRIGGHSSIERCRKTREAGDYVSPGGFGLPASNPFVTAPPVDFSRDDVFCLDGQRLLLVSGTYGANGAVYKPELDPFTRVTSRNGNNSASASTYTGPQYFTVERKDGSISEYGNSTDSRIERNQCGGSTGLACAISAWALNRVEDSTGNYLTHHYTKFLDGVQTTSGAGSDEYVLSEVRYTGKRVLPGQSGSASTPYARVLFGYSLDTASPERGWQAGSRAARTRRLDWIKVQDPFSGTPRTIRYYGLTYATSGSNSGSRQLTSVQECNKGPGDTGVDSTQVCYPATTFTESSAKYQLNAQGDGSFPASIDVSDRKGVRFGDVDGDGRLDVVWARNTGESTCKSRIYVSYGDRAISGGASSLTLATPEQQGVCVAQEMSEDSDWWQLFDYDGDGRDDLLVLDNSIGGGWRVYAAASQRPDSSGAAAFVTGTSLLNGMSLGDTLLRLIDLNGDGLLDVMYAVQDPVNPFEYHLRSRLRERYEISSGMFGLRFGAEKPFQIRFAPDDPCSWEYPGTPKPTSCSYTLAPWSRDKLVAVEIDGDGRGDLIFEVNRTYDTLQGDGETEIRFLLPDQMDALHAELAAEPEAVSFQRYWQFFTSRTDQFLVEFQSYDSLRMYENSVGELPTDIRHIQLADFNGDGLTDLLYRVPSVSNGQTWRLRLNTGKGFATAYYSATGIVNPDLVQVADVNGDGRADLLYPPTGNTCGAGDISNTNRPFCVRYGQSATDGLAAARHVPGGGAWATANPFDHEHFFADFDGDGAVDYVRFRRANSNPKLFTSRSSTRHQARDVIVQITDGIGAITQIGYQPLTNAAVYRRDTGSLIAAVPNGRGSPTFDLLAPMYVVAKANSSAPTYEDAAAMAKVGYRYTGAKLQSGGRGYLGFREITTFDGVQSTSPARHVVSRTQYRQDFPFVGSPEASQTHVVTGALSYGSAAIDACRADPEAIGQSCFYSVGSSWPGAVGTRIAGSVSVWACQGTGNGATCPIAANPLRQACIDLSQPSANNDFNPLGTQQPIFPYLTGSSEESRAYDSSGTGSGSWLGTTESLFCYEDTFGNLTYSRVNQWDGTDPAGKVLSSQVTENSYANDATAWRLGRLTSSQVQSSNECEIGPDGAAACTNWQARTSGFAYDLTSSAKTGLLTQEKIQPSGDATQALRTLHTLDAYGNRTYSFQCSAYEADGSTLTDAECTTPARVSHRPVGLAGEITAVHRYARTAYDAKGRYATATYLPYYTGTAGPSGTVTELASMTINSRDEFGNPTQQTAINGVVSQARSGALGRPYYSGDSTGAASTTTYRWCSQVACPADAVYRSRTVSSASGSNQLAPTSWTYHDRLRRPILSVVQGFAAGSFSATCAYYDKKTRPERGSEPFFLSSAAVNGEPDFQGGTYDACGSAAWTHHEYDVLGRPVKMTMPDASTATVAYAGLVTTTTNAKGQKAQETRNAIGQVIQTRQANPGTPSSLGMTLEMTYDAHGNLRSLTRNAGRGEIVTRYEYDALGRRTKSIDPDRGTEQAFHNAAGEVIRTIDGVGMEVRMDYDALGRLWRRQSGRTAAASAPPPAGRIFADGFEEPDLPTPGLTTDHWVYDTALHGKGQLHSEERSVPNEPTWRRTLSYDNQGRPSSRATLLDATTRTESWLYDSLGRLYRHTDASGSTVEHTWNVRGYAYRLRNAATPSEVYQQINALNARGQVTEELRGAATLSRDFHPLRGWLTGITTTTATTLQNLTYDHDLLGNLTQRKDLRANQVEDFAYDGLNRLTDATVKVGTMPTVTALNLSYDLLGNICSKNGQLYSYDGRDGCNASGTSATASPHAVTQIGSATYRYGKRGELEYSQDGFSAANDRWFAYDGLQNLSLVLVGQLMAPSAELNLRYSPGGERYRREERIASATTTTRSVGSVEFITRPDGVVETKRHIAGLLIETRYSNGAATTKRYLYPDGLGSIDAITNEAGTLQERLGFDSHGSRRNGDDWRSAITGYTPQTTTRGFTGHEHLDPFKLIHMNGRVYDPSMGRFIQADPVLDQGIQGLNRYSYALNNPLTLTDPSGYSSWNKWLRTAAAIVITYYTGGAAGSLYAAGNTAGAFAMAAAGGFAAGAIQSGTVKGGLYGAFGGGAFFGVGTAFTQANAGWAHTGNQLNSIGRVAKTVSHGMVGGVMSDLQGGKFGHGFVSAGATQAVSPQIDNRINSAPGRVVAAAALGGTVSAVTGGKFANGAVTAAFSYAFNEIAHRETRNEWADSDGLSNMRKHADSTLESARAGLDGVVELSAGELDVIMNYYAAELDHRQSIRGSYAKMSFEEFALELWRAADTRFYGADGIGYGGTRFRIIGAPEQLSGVYFGGDINYFYQGFLHGARGSSLGQMHNSIINWNVFGGGTIANTVPRLRWAEFGYDFWKNRP